MIIISKRDGESNESLMRKYSRAFRSSGFGDDAKSHQVFHRKPNKNQQRKSAKRRREAREEREFLIKTGKLVIPTYRSKHN
jgi:hypothetical protein